MQGPHAYIEGPPITPEEIQREIEADLARAGVAFLDAAEHSIIRGELDGPASGRIYPSKAKGGGIHQASAKDQQPHADRGFDGGLLSELQKVDEELKGPNPNGWTGFEDDAADVAEILDRGRRDGKMAQRPWRDIALAAGAAAADEELRKGPDKP